MKEFVIMGYEFNNEKSYQAAKKELEEILQLKNQFDITKFKGGLDFYNSLMEHKLNSTPIGLEYTRNIQRDLIKNTNSKNNIPNVMIPDIIDENSIKDIKNKREKSDKTKQLEKNVSKYKDLYIKMLIVNAILVLTVVAMFIISKGAEKYDVDYFRESIENDYLDWENNLKERESSIEAKENAE